MSDSGRFAVAGAIARALLYEGYLLYPYRASSTKNRYRFTFGVLYPQAWVAAQSPTSDRASSRTEVLLVGEQARLWVRVAYLQLATRADDGWQEAIERCHDLGPIAVEELLAGPREWHLAQPAPDGGIGRALALRLTLSAVRDGDVTRIAALVENIAEDAGDDRPAALAASAVSTHLMLAVDEGEFVSLLETPEPLRAASRRCRNEGTWPVLVGEAGARDLVLSSPIILYDHPRVAPESPLDLFDATEIDEILRLRIATMTPAEKREMAALDERARALLERSEALDAATLGALHGTLRGDALAPVAGVAQSRAAGFAIGAKVRLRPSGNTDVLDVVLAGKVATVRRIEQDYEGRVLLAVTVDEDPGQDLGEHGHRFFYRADEVEPLVDGSAPAG